MSPRPNAGGSGGRPALNTPHDRHRHDPYPPPTPEAAARIARLERALVARTQARRDVMEALVRLEAAQRVEDEASAARELEAECERRIERLRAVEGEVRRLTEARALEERVRDLV